MGKTEWERGRALRDPWVIDNVHLAFRLLLSVVLGGLIGFERERNNHAAGLRTHILVCMGSALIMVLSMYGFAAFVDEPNVRIDPARLAAQVITGIGFLGAGTIVMTGRGISGLTTAASVWVVMAIGLSVGAGFYFPAILGAMLVFLILWGLNIIERRYLNTRRESVLTLLADEEGMAVDAFRELIAHKGCKLVRVQFPAGLESSGDYRNLRRVQLTLVLSHRDQLLPIADEFRKVPGVRSVIVE